MINLMDFPQNAAIRTYDELERLDEKAPAVHVVAFSSDGETILAGLDDWTARLWSVSTGKQLMVLRGHGGPVISAGFSPDGNTILTGSVDRTACLWDAKTGIPLKTLRKHIWPLFSAVFSSDGMTIITSSLDTLNFLWSSSESSLEWACTREYLAQELYLKMWKLVKARD